jgi:hypothetical protein
MLPRLSPATHSDADGQDNAFSTAGIGPLVSRQAANPLESSAKKSRPSTVDDWHPRLHSHAT